MKSRKLGTTTSLAIAALVITGGCESSPRSPVDKASSTEVKVSGKVTVKGMPASKGKVTVSPTGPAFVERITDIRRDGSYEVTTFVGMNSFSVRGTGNPAAGDAYNKANFEVKEGQNTINLDLPLTDK